MGKLEGKVAIVTGAARGLGRAYARRLAGLGARVAVVDRDLRSHAASATETQDMTGADSTVAEIEAAGGSARGIELDVSDAAALEAMTERLVSEWGRIDVLVVNAGDGRGQPIETTVGSLDPALLRRTVRMTLSDTVSTINAVAPTMKAQRSGKIITASSVAGAAVDGGYAPYSTAKAAISGWAAIAHYTRHLAQDLRPFGVTANCIGPGVITTGRIMATVIPGSIQGHRDRTELVALRSLGTVDDSARIIDFLATDLSDYVTGALIPIEGGLVRG